MTAGLPTPPHCRLRRSCAALSARPSNHAAVCWVRVGGPYQTAHGIEDTLAATVAASGNTLSTHCVLNEHIHHVSLDGGSAYRTAVSKGHRDDRVYRSRSNTLDPFRPTHEMKEHHDAMMAHGGRSPSGHIHSPLACQLRQQTMRQRVQIFVMPY